MKARLLAALLISMLLLASATPAALAQDAAGEDDGGNGNADITVVDCSQVQNAFGSQGQYGNANAVAQYESDAIAEVAQELNISQSQVNACLVGNPDDNNSGTDDGNPDDDGNPGDDENLAEGEEAVDADTIPKGDLPNTGGLSLITAIAGVALLFGGVSLIRTGRGR